MGSDPARSGQCLILKQDLPYAGRSVSSSAYVTEIINFCAILQMLIRYIIMNDKKKIDEIQAEVDRNYEAFRKLLPDIPQSNVGKFAVMHDAEIVEYFDTAADAMTYAKERFKGGMLFSVQQVKDRVVDLGYFSHAMHNISI